MIPYGRQHITQDDIDAVVETLQSDFLTQGPKIDEFERAFAAYCGVKYAVAVSSCTAGLHLAYMAAGLGPEKLLWTVPNTFVATANAALYCGADVDFVDIDPNTWNMSAEALEEKLKTAQTIPDIVAPVHFAGQSCDMKAISALADQYGFNVIEDAAHCAGAGYNEEKIGACTFSGAAVFSLHPVKIITSGEGGIVTTNSEEMYQKMLRLRTHGITKDAAFLNNKDVGPWYFEQLDLGYHYRMTDIQAALGLSQLARLDGYIEKRRVLVARYNDLFADADLQLPAVIGGAAPSWHLYAVLVPDAARRREIFESMRAAGIGVNVHYIPVHTHPYFQNHGFKDAHFPVSEEYYSRAITLPLYPALTQDEQDYVVRTLKDLV